MQSYLQYRAFRRYARNSQSESTDSNIPPYINEPQQADRLNWTNLSSEDTNPVDKIEAEGFTNEEPPDATFFVSFEGDDDPFDPHNWSFAARALVTAQLGAIALVGGMAAAIDAPAISQAAREFGISEVAESLATGIFLMGFGSSGFFGGPLSETFGRSPVYIGSLSVFALFTIGSALSPDLGSQLVCRFFAGFAACTPFTTAGGSLSDLWTPIERSYTFPLFATTAFVGPTIAPVIGGFVAESTVVSWRWTEWTTLIMVSLVLLIVLLFMPETFAPVLLRWKAQHLRVATGDARYKAPVEIKGSSFWVKMKVAIARPFILGLTEPIVIIFSLYFAIIFIILFGFVPGYDFIFKDTYNLSQGITGVLFLGIGVGLGFATALVHVVHLWGNRKIKKLQEAYPGSTVKLPPEHRLWLAMLGAPGIPIALFWMGWTAFPGISFWSPLVASVFFGYGVLTIFISVYQYIIDSYEIYAASALGMTTVVRFLAAGAMMEVTIPMYHNLGVHWTLTLLGSIGLLFTPAPFLLYKYGHIIRRYSKYAVT